jgi:VWFA-related protein
MPSKKLLLLALVLVLFATLALGQQDAVFTSGVDVVNVLATVRDRHGRLVNGLTKDDFLLKEDGQPQTIRYFSRQADLPLTVGLLVDTSLSQRRIIGQERSASAEFLARVLDETKDQAFLIRFDFDVELLQDLTSSKKLLQQALGDLHLPSERVFRTGGSQSRRDPVYGGRQLGGQPYDRQFPGGGIPGDPFPGGIPGRRFPRGRRGGNIPGGPTGRTGSGMVGTAMYDAVYLAADEVLRDQAGRKAMILISDGVDMGSTLDSAAAIEAAQRADTVIYAVHYSDDEGYRLQAGTRTGPDGWRPRGEYALETLCNQTGGRLYKLSGDMTLAGIFGQIEEELRNQYSIGYTPTNNSDSTGFRRITLNVKDGSAKVYSRAGYYPRPK